MQPPELHDSLSTGNPSLPFSAPRVVHIEPMPLFVTAQAPVASVQMILPPWKACVQAVAVHDSGAVGYPRLLKGPPMASHLVPMPPRNTGTEGVAVLQ
jgi:hypothetical protein